MAHKSLLKKLSMSIALNSRLITPKPYIQSVRYFTGHAIDTIRPVESNEEYIKWQNGGGLVHRSGVTFCDSKKCVVEVGAVVHSGTSISENVHIGSGSVIGHDVSIGPNTKIGYNVSLANCDIGKSCIIHSGVCIGQDGFGFLLGDDGNMLKKPQNLRVMIGDNVEIGANTCIDRGSWRDTVIGDYSTIDNLVQIGHNVVIGNNCLLCGQVGIAGSATLGDYVTLGGRVAVRDHVSIASKVRLAANSCVTKNILVAGDYGGFPAVPIREWRKQVAMHRKVQHETFPEVKTCQEVEVSSES